MEESGGILICRLSLKPAQAGMHEEKRNKRSPFSLSPVELSLLFGDDGLVNTAAAVDEVKGCSPYNGCVSSGSGYRAVKEHVNHLLEKAGQGTLPFFFFFFPTPFLFVFSPCLFRLPLRKWSILASRAVVLGSLDVVRCGVVRRCCAMRCGGINF